MTAYIYHRQNSLKNILDQELLLGIILIISAIISYYAWKWWSNLKIGTETS